MVSASPGQEGVRRVSKAEQGPARTVPDCWFSALAPRMTATLEAPGFSSDVLSRFFTQLA